MSWLDSLIPIFVGHRTQITGVLTILLNAARLIGPMVGFPLPAGIEHISDILTGLGAGSSALFAAAKIDRQAPSIGTPLKDPVVVKAEGNG